MRNEMIDLLDDAMSDWDDVISECQENGEVPPDSFVEHIADHLIANGATISTEARPLKEWHEDIGDVLWWKFPIEEPPYVGSPLDLNWPAYHTHRTPIVVPEPPKEEA